MERLVMLPHKKTKPFVPEEPKYNSEAFFEFCEKYDIVSYLEEGKKKKWMDLFKGEFKRTLKKIKRRKKLI
jgi:hypothetical protein